MQGLRDRMVSQIRKSHGETIARRAADGEPVLTECMDSLERMDFIVGVENFVDICIPDAVTMDMKTIDDVAKYIDTMTSGPAHGAH